MYSNEGTTVITIKDKTMKKKAKTILCNSTFLGMYYAILGKTVGAKMR
jgi:hypothetical protein